MQKLQFEASWEKAIAPADRLVIEQLFHETQASLTQGVQCEMVRTAINHKQQLLITVLIHNATETSLSFSHRNVAYTTTNDTIVQAFHLPALRIPPQRSMPWTFIFTETVPVELVGSVRIFID